MRRLRMHLPTIVVAVVTAAVVAAAPAIGHGVQHALFAHNADKVDGKHAVGSGVSRSKAAGKLVATKKKGPAKGRFAAKFLPRGVGLGLLGGSWSSVSSGNGGLALSPIADGIGASANTIVAPVDFKVRRFTVRLITQQTSGTRTFNLQLIGQASIPLCTISAGGTSCTSNKVVTVPAGSRFNMSVSVTNAQPSTTATYGWLATT